MPPTKTYAFRTPGSKAEVESGLDFQPKFDADGLIPAIVTDAPVVGVALTAQTTVPGCATGVTNAHDLDVATRFCIEVAKLFGQGQCAFYDVDEWAELQRRYGSLKHLQTAGVAA